MNDTFCEACEAKNTLEAKIERPAAYRGVIETVIVCGACGARTHVAFTRAELEEAAAEARRITDPAERKLALAHYNALFSAFQAQMQEWVK